MSHSQEEGFMAWHKGIQNRNRYVCPRIRPFLVNKFNFLRLQRLCPTLLRARAHNKKRTSGLKAKTSVRGYIAELHMQVYMANPLSLSLFDASSSSNNGPHSQGPSGPNRAMPPRCAMRFESRTPKSLAMRQRFFTSDVETP